MSTFVIKRKWTLLLVETVNIFIILFFANPEPIHISPTAIVGHNSWASAEHPDFSANPLSLSCLKWFA